MRWCFYWNEIFAIPNFHTCSIMYRKDLVNAFSAVDCFILSNDYSHDIWVTILSLFFSTLGVNSNYTLILENAGCYHPRFTNSLEKAQPISQDVFFVQKSVSKSNIFDGYHAIYTIRRLLMSMDFIWTGSARVHPSILKPLNTTATERWNRKNKANKIDFCRNCNKNIVFAELSVWAEPGGWDLSHSKAYW